MLLGLVALATPTTASAKDPENKLLYMYRLYYLPFGLEFEEGRTANDILPFLPEKYPDPSRLITAQELKTLDEEWTGLKKSWSKRSLLETTKVPLDRSVRITQKLASHRIPLTRSAFDGISIGDRIQIKEAMKSKPPQVQATFRQIRFLKSLLTPLELEKLNFFVVGASWCNSSREYRILMESYFKRFPSSKINFHSLVIDDPKEKIFDSKLLKELFPNPKLYSHNTIPRFLAIEVVNGKTRLYEEGEALREVYERHFKKHRGFLDSQTSLLGKSEKKPSVDPFLSSVSK